MKNIPHILAFVGFGVLCSLAFISPTKEVALIPILETETVAKQTYPVKITIESIGVNAPVELVGIQGDAMAVPTLGGNVGWYRFGTEPGKSGSAVFAGHVNWMDGKDAVFTNLKNIQIEDIVSVTNNYGELSHFRVTDIQEFPLYADTSHIFVSSDGIARLNLITCDGTWNDWLNTHESRLVVFTEKIEQIKMP